MKRVTIHEIDITLNAGLVLADNQIVVRLEPTFQRKAGIDSAQVGWRVTYITETKE